MLRLLPPTNQVLIQLLWNIYLTFTHDKFPLNETEANFFSNVRTFETIKPQGYG